MNNNFDDFYSNNNPITQTPIELMNDDLFIPQQQHSQIQSQQQYQEAFSNDLCDVDFEPQHYQQYQTHNQNNYDFFDPYVAQSQVQYQQTHVNDSFGLSIPGVVYSSLEQVNYQDDEPIQEEKNVKSEETTTEPSKNDIENLMKLTLRLKKKTLRSSSFTHQTFPMLASLIVDNIKSSNKAALDLVCVIDHSGSMNGEKIELVKNTFKYLLKYLTENDRLSIVIFDDRAARLVPLMRNTEANKETILAKISQINDAGGTDINLGMQHAFKILQQRRYKNPVSSIFLLSDGLDGGAQHNVKGSLERFNIGDDVIINTFGFGNDHDPQLMNDIADLRDGNFYFIEKLDTVDEAFVDCLGGLLSSVGQNVVIKIKPEQSEKLQGVKIVKAYGEESMWAKEDETFITKMSTLISGRQKDFVLELNIPSNDKELLDHEKSIKVASAEADITLLDSQHLIKKAELYITLLNETEEFKEEEDDREVMKNFYRVKGALVIGDARKLADSSKYDEAKKTLTNFKEELENSFLKQEEFIKNLIKDILQAIDSVNPKVYEDVGKHYMFENARAQMYQKSNLKSANCYQNDFQFDLVASVKQMKNN